MGKKITGYLAKGNDSEIYTEYREGDLPGIAISHGMFGNSTMVSCLADEFTTYTGKASVCWDRRKHGRSKDYKNYSAEEYLEAEVGDIDLILDNYGLKRVILVGLSAGCHPCIKYASELPERVGGLALISGSSDFAKTHPVSSKFHEKLGKFAFENLGKYGYMGITIAGFKFLNYLFKSVGLDEEVEYSDFKHLRQLIEKQKPGFLPRGFKDFLAFEEIGYWTFGRPRLNNLKEMFRAAKHVFESDLTEDASKIVCPIYLVQGDKDEFLGGNIELVAETFANASELETRLVQGEGHGLIFNNEAREVRGISQFFEL